MTATRQQLRDDIADRIALAKHARGLGLRAAMARQIELIREARREMRDAKKSQR